MQTLQKVLEEMCKAFNWFYGFITFFKRLLGEHYPPLNSVDTF